MQLPTPVPRPFDTLITYLKEGRIKVPQFQRDFVWTPQQTSKLLDSMLKGYPIGTFILWKTHERLKSIRNVGNLKLKESPDGDAVEYILDGQQRLTSLFAIHEGASVAQNGKTFDFKSILIDLDSPEQSDSDLVVTEQLVGRTYVSVFSLLTEGFAYFGTNFKKDYHDKIDTYKKRLTGYLFSTIELPDAPLDVACEVFTRINTTGKELTLFEIMVAKTYDEKANFDLAIEWSNLVENDGSEKDLEDVGYESLPSAVILQVISAHLRSQVSSKDILQLPKKDFIDTWANAKKAVFLAVDYLKDRLSVPVSGLLPYNAIVVVFAYYFLRNGLRNPNADQDRMLRLYFWWASLGGRFSSGADSKTVSDLGKMKSIAKGESPDYQGEAVVLRTEDLQWRNFSTSDAMCKAVLCFFASLRPRSFEDNSPVRLDNQFLVQSNSKNYHHFFPKNYLLKSGMEAWKANSIVNITLVSEYLNKGKIKDKPPSVYTKEFGTKNGSFAEALQSHLIDDLTAFGVETDEYEKFIERRCARLIEELNVRLEGKK